MPPRLRATVLFTLAESGIPGYVDVAQDATRHRDTSGRSGYRLWVDSHQFNRAEDLLMTLLRKDPG